MHDCTSYNASSRFSFTWPVFFYALHLVYTGMKNGYMVHDTDYSLYVSYVCGLKLHILDSGTSFSMVILLTVARFLLSVYSRC